MAPGPVEGVVRARLDAADGVQVALIESRPVLIGRDEACDLSFPTESRLSRRAAHVSWNGFGVVIANLSRTHGLTVTAATTTARLPSRTASGPTTGFFVAAGTATLTGPSWSSTPFAVTIEVGSGPAPADSAVNVALTRTHEPFRLKPYTKEFLTALMLCRPRLLRPAEVVPPPPVPQLTHQILEATSSWHLLREMEVDESVRTRLKGRVTEHVKELRAKVLRHGLVPHGTQVAPAVLVEVLVVSEAVTPHHLGLLEDASWLEWQETHWWET